MTEVPLLWVAIKRGGNEQTCMSVRSLWLWSENELQGTCREAGSVVQPTADGSPGSGQQ